MVSTVEVELLVLCLLVVLLGAGAIEYLRQIRNAIHEDFESAVARSILQTEIKVTPEKPKVIRPCHCEHAYVQHWTVTSESGPGVPGGKCHHTDEAGRSDCACQLYKPKRGPWPTDPPRV
jgi:hypothetical protein